MQDNRSRYLHNRAAKRANEVRRRRATVDNPQWAMSRPAEWYKNRDNLRSIKDTLTNIKGNRDFLTTDRNESRNMYQMVMNNMYGGKGARMLDTRGLPEGARRTGRTLFTDPAKSQGFFGDLKSLVTGKNKAAVRAPEWNPLHEPGYGRDWYVNEFGQPWGEKLTGLMKLAPGIGMASRFIGGDEKKPLPSDRSWIPEDVGSYKQAPLIDLEEINRDIEDAVGITGLVDDTPEERAEYAQRTFGADRHPRPHEEIPYLTDEAAAIQKEFNTNPYFRDLAGENVVLPFEKDRRGHPHLETYTPDKGPSLGTASPHDFSEGIEVPPWLTDPSLPMPEELTEGEYIPGQYSDEVIEEEAPPPIIQFDDSGRETGIASMMKSGLNLAGRRPYEDEYRAFVESSGPSKVMVTYEDFMENYLPRIQESRGVFRAGLNSQGRR